MEDARCWLLAGLIRFAGLMFNGLMFNGLMFNGLMVEVFSNYGLVDGGYKMFEN